MNCPKFLIIIIFIISIIACNNEEAPVIEDYQIGKNFYTIDIDGDTREYYVHVPNGYDPSIKTSMVFMLHGTTGDGERFYNISGWTDVGETENIITVFPSSWSYCLIVDGQVKNTTKWNTYGNEYCDGEQPKDDIKFFRALIDKLSNQFNLDNKRIYICGFSNGGRMSAQCAIEMGDVFAAAVGCSGVLPGGQNYQAVRQLPFYLQTGNLDESVFGSNPDFPLVEFPNLIKNNPSFLEITDRYTQIFGMSSDYQLSGIPEQYAIASFEGLNNSPPREFKFVFIDGLAHSYPNGTNHPFKGAENHWIWLKQYVLD